VAETYFVSFLGTQALAGVALVFPSDADADDGQRRSSGGGVASAVARALGAGRRDDAARGVACAGAGRDLRASSHRCSITRRPAGSNRAPVGEGASLAAALTYSNAVFLAAVPLWITALLAAALRGAGDVKVPAWGHVRRRTRSDPAVGRR